MRTLWASWLAYILIGCGLGERDLGRLAEMASGPEKLAIIVQDGSLDPALRSGAALTLLDLRRPGVDGTAAMVRALDRLPRGARGAVVEGMIEGLRARMAPGPEGLTAEAVAAKDSAFRLLQMAEGGARARLSALLGSWLAADFRARADAGDVHAEAIGDALDAAGLQALAGCLQPKMGEAALRRVTELLARRADPATRREVGARLVQLEQAWRTPAQLDWLATETAQALRRQGAVQAPAELVQEQARARRRHILTAVLLPALGRFAAEPAVARHLLALARRDLPAVSEAERARALEVLEGNVLREQRQPLLDLALDEARPLQLRLLALARAGELRDQASLASLVVLMGERQRSALRQAAAEQLLDIGGPEALATFFRSLPRYWDTDFSRGELEAYSARINTFAPEPAVVLLMAAKLHSKRWWARVLALQYFAAQGAKEDVWRIRQHVHDLIPVRGSDWPAGYTVGQEAQAAVAKALRRHKLPFRRRPPRGA